MPLDRYLQQDVDSDESTQQGAAETLREYKGRSTRSCLEYPTILEISPT